MMLYLVEMAFLEDGDSMDFPLPRPVYGLADGFGFFAELGPDYKRARKAYYDMLRAVRHVAVGGSNDRVQLARRYYDAHQDLMGGTFSEHYAIGDYFPDFPSEFLSPKTIAKLRRGDLDFIED